MKSFKDLFFGILIYYFIATLLPFSAVIVTGENILLWFSILIFGLVHGFLVNYLTSNTKMKVFQNFLAITSIIIFPGLPNRFVLVIPFLLGVLTSKITLLSKPKIILALLVTIFIFGSMLSTSEVVSLVGHEPIDENYNHDSYIFLKTVYLMKDGRPYYTAFDQAVINDVRADKPPDTVFGYRLPTLFLLWSILPNPGVSIWIIFVIVGFTLLISSYQIAQKFSSPSFAIIAPYFLVPYLLFSSKSHWFLISEYWAMFLLVFYLAFLLNKKYHLAYSSLLLGLLIRELVFIPALAGFGLSVLVRSKRHFLFYLSIILVFLIFYLIHIFLIAHTLSGSKGLSIDRLLGGGINFVRSTLAFGTQYYLSIKWGLQNMALYLLITFLGGIFLLLSNNEERMLIVISYLTCFGFPVVFLFIAVSKFNDYWGIMYVPIMLSILPWSLYSLTKLSRLGHIS